MARKKAAPPSFEEIARAESRAVGLLAASDTATWQCVLGNMDQLPRCPALLVRALVELDDVLGWRTRGLEAVASLHPDEGQGIWFGFTPWLAAGVVAHLPPTDPVALTLRYEAEREYVETDAAERLIVMTDEIEEAGTTPKHRSVLGRALVLLARRLHEDGELEGASAAALRAMDIFTTLGDERWEAQATGVRAASLLAHGKIDEALALHDLLCKVGKPWYAIDISARPHKRRSADPRAAALAEAADVILAGYPKDYPQWSAALRAVAERTGHPGCAERVEASRHVLAPPQEDEPDHGPWR